MKTKEEIEARLTYLRDNLSILDEEKIFTANATRNKIEALMWVIEEW